MHRTEQHDPGHAVTRAGQGVVGARGDRAVDAAGARSDWARRPECAPGVRVPAACPPARGPAAVAIADWAAVEGDRLTRAQDFSRPGPGGDSVLGYRPAAATMMREEHGPAVPELARRMTVCSCQADPARALVPVLTAMPEDGIPLGDILADSGYAHRDAEGWAIPLRQAGAQLIAG